MLCHLVSSLVMVWKVHVIAFHLCILTSSCLEGHCQSCFWGNWRLHKSQKTQTMLRSHSQRKLELECVGISKSKQSRLWFDLHVLKLIASCLKGHCLSFCSNSRSCLMQHNLTVVGFQHHHAFSGWLGQLVNQWHYIKFWGCKY